MANILETDPGLQQVKALVAMQLAFEEANALAAKKRLLIDYGDPNLAASVLGEHALAGTEYQVYQTQPGPTAAPTSPFATLAEAQRAANHSWLGVRQVPYGQGVDVLAAQTNPFSQLKQIQRGFDESKLSLDQALNKANLWRSSERGRQYGQLGQAKLQSEYQAGLAAQDKLTEINTGLAGAKLAAQERLVAANQDAYNRQLEFGLQYPSSTGASKNIMGANRTGRPTEGVGSTTGYGPTRPLPPLPPIMPGAAVATGSG